MGHTARVVGFTKEELLDADNGEEIVEKRTFYAFEEDSALKTWKGSINRLVWMVVQIVQELWI